MIGIRQTDFIVRHIRSLICLRNFNWPSAIRIHLLVRIRVVLSLDDLDGGRVALHEPCCRWWLLLSQTRKVNRCWIHPRCSLDSSVGYGARDWFVSLIIVLDGGTRAVARSHALTAQVVRWTHECLAVRSRIDRLKRVISGLLSILFPSWGARRFLLPRFLVAYRLDRTCSFRLLFTLRLHWWLSRVSVFLFSFLWVVAGRALLRRNVVKVKFHCKSRGVLCEWSCLYLVKRG